MNQSLGGVAKEQNFAEMLHILDREKHGESVTVEQMKQKEIIGRSAWKSIAFSIIFLLSIISYALADTQKIYLTIDLCPSNKRYEERLFDYFENLGRKQGKPVPVAIAVSGKWILKHQDELAVIKSLKHLEITWVNHSYSHPKGDGYLDNPNVNFTREVKDNIRLMEKNGLKPSKYFRFPGLVHNKLRLKQLAAMGYVNLDADAWLGKGQPIKDGSIVLIHGNGNEAPEVVDKFINYLKANQSEIEKLSCH